MTWTLPCDMNTEYVRHHSTTAVFSDSQGAQLIGVSCKLYVGLLSFRHLTIWKCYLHIPSNNCETVITIVMWQN